MGKEQDQIESVLLAVFTFFTFLLIISSFSLDPGRIGISGRAVEVVQGEPTVQAVIFFLVLIAIGLYIKRRSE